MARLSDKELVEQLLEQLAPTVQQAFLDAVAGIRDNVTLEAVIDRLEKGDVQGAVNVMHLDVDAYSQLETAISNAYASGGQAFVGNMPKLRDPGGHLLLFRWGVRNLRAEQQLRDHAAQMVTGDLLQPARDGIAQMLSDGLSRGENPRIMARAVVGLRQNNGVRIGGYVGLSGPQQKTVEWVRQALASNDIEGMKRYLGITDAMLKEMPRRELLTFLKNRKTDPGLKLRDHRFDGSILNVIEGKARLDGSAAAKVTAQLSERYIDLRGKVLARHETFIALSASKHAAYQQQIDAGKLAEQDVKKKWHHRPRENPRMQHIEMNGQTVALDADFVAPDGTRMRYPHDPRAPAYHTIGCGCDAQYDVDFTAAALRQYRARTGL